MIYVSNYKKISSDQGHWNSLQLRELFIGKKFGIMGDGGYTFNVKDEKFRIIGINPYTKPKNSKGVIRELTEEEKKFNRKVSQTRVIAENTFSRIKNWGILSGKYRHYSPQRTFFIDPNTVFRTCCYLTQMQILKKPLRSLEWVHPSKKCSFLLY